ncbi:MAG: hypothetical protein ACK55Z_17500 [bacterium]|jgi:hypothetical protein
MLSVIYLIFFSINILTYFGMTSVKNFMAILDRLSLIFEMEEYKRNRQTECDPKDVSIQVNNCSFSWGFRVKED